MKKLIISCAFLMFGIASAHAAPATPTAPVCVDAAELLSDVPPGSAKSEGFILNELIKPECGMSLQEAVDTIVLAGGETIPSLAAALIVDPKFEYVPPKDPTLGLDPTAAGGSKVKTVSLVTGPGGGGGGGLVVSP